MTTTKAKAVKDCRGVGCPMNLVYLKVELAKLQSGEVLEIFLDDGAPINNVPAGPALNSNMLQDFNQSTGLELSKKAREKMLAINPEIEVNTYHQCLRANDIREIIADYDFVVDGTDNFPTKFLVNDACVMEKIPFSHGGILRFDGQTMTVVPGESSCYRCAFREPPPPDAVPTCSQAGVLGAIAGMLGTIQAAEALKYVTGVGELLAGTLLTFDAKTMEFRKLKINKQDNCPICGETPSITELVDIEQAVCSLGN